MRTTVLAGLFFFVIAGAAGAADAPATAELPLLAAPRAPVQGPPRSEAADAATYERCLKLAKGHPGDARAFAQHWHDRGGAHPADHCLAVALIGLKQYKEAAGRLEKL